MLILGHLVVMGEINTCLCGNYFQTERVNKLYHMRRKVVLRKIKRGRGVIVEVREGLTGRMVWVGDEAPEPVGWAEKALKAL